MAAKICFETVLSVFVVIFGLIRVSSAQYSIKSQTVADCLRGDTDLTHEFFDISQQRCTECAQTRDFQTVSADGLQCICQPGTRLTRDFGGAVINCELCPQGMVSSADGWNCVRCGANNPFNPVTNQCQACADGQIAVERQLDGSWLNPANPLLTCEACASNTGSDTEGQQCLRCNQVLSVLPSLSNCQCPDGQRASGLCFESPDDIAFSTTQLYKVTFGDEVFDSAYFIEHIIGAAGMCASKYGNLTACQVLSHMCVMLTYTRAFVPSTSDACAIYDNYYSSSIALRQLDDWPQNLPWLYYFEEDGDRILTDTSIPLQFSFPDMQIPFQAASFTLNGTFLGFRSLTNGMLQLCKNAQNIMDSAYVFGTTYKQECDISVEDLFTMKEEDMVFYDIYLEYTENNQKQLYAVPILITNYLDQNGQAVNQGSDRAQWQLVRRLFLVDVVSGRQDTAFTDASGTVTSTSTLRAVRYARSIIIHFTLQDDQSSGLIYPPYIEVTYGVATLEDRNSDRQVTVSFEVSYEMSLNKYNNDISIAVGVLCALAVLYSGLQSWAWSRRAGKMAIDFVSIMKFTIYLCGNLANVFFVISFGSSLWWWIFYKRQTNVYLIVPDNADNSGFLAYLASALALKFLQLIHMVICQVTIDIFFVDWERPHGSIASSNGQQKTEETPVSIWRTYFVANEWNEIQTIRKINPIFQIFIVVLFLHVIGFGNLATQDPQSQFSLSSNQYHSSFSSTFRFAILALVYLIVALVQWIFYTFIYERFVEDKVRQYVDLCSMSNVSVFILENDQFGYYIHGRSVHGRSDTGMKQMHENLKKEEEDLCGQRGLLPNTEQQTFQMAVPRKLRAQYDRVILPINNPAPGVGAGARSPGVAGGSHVDPHTQKSIQAYSVLNRFLQAFIDHSLKDVDYIIKDKMLLENVLNMEFQDAATDGLFYNDSGHSFDSVLFFGNETTLTIFEILFFGIVDVLSHNYVLAAILTYLLMEVVTMIRDSLGKSNLAKKTLVDKRFLI